RRRRARGHTPAGPVTLETLSVASLTLFARISIFGFAIAQRLDDGVAARVARIQVPHVCWLPTSAATLHQLCEPVRHATSPTTSFNRTGRFHAGVVAGPPSTEQLRPP